jgi:16S rRNA pseudouridine516 synthase
MRRQWSLGFVPETFLTKNCGCCGFYRTLAPGVFYVFRMYRPQAHVHIALHKPRGFSCSHNSGESPIIDELMGEMWGELPLQPIGRLDRDTSGLLILTTDGQLIHQLAQPGKKVEKKYRIGYRGVLPEDAVALCAKGMRIEGYATPTLPSRLVIERPTRFRSAESEERLGEATLVLHEGRHHQVRRMFRALGSNVVTLHRERFGAYELPPEMTPGEHIEIDAAFLFPPLA